MKETELSTMDYSTSRKDDLSGKDEGNDKQVKNINTIRDKISNTVTYINDELFRNLSNNAIIDSELDDIKNRSKVESI